MANNKNALNEINNNKVKEIEFSSAEDDISVYIDEDAKNLAKLFVILNQINEREVAC